MGMRKIKAINSEDARLAGSRDRQETKSLIAAQSHGGQNILMAIGPR